MTRQSVSPSLVTSYHALLAARARPHWTYVVRDAAGQVLYVGCTVNPLGRMRQHKATRTSWWADRATVYWREYPDFNAARAAEADLIRTLQPLHNTLKRGAAA